MSKSRRPNPGRSVRQALLAAAVASSVALSACGESADDLLAKARTSIEKNEPKAAEIHLKNLLQKQDSGEARFLLAEVYLAAANHLGAEKEYRRALDAGFDKARVAPGLAETLLRLGKPQEVLDMIAGANPTDPLAKARLLTAVGRAQLALRKPEAAKASFEAALAARAEHVPARVSLIGMQVAGGDVASAAQAADALLAESPGAAEALALKGDLEFAQGRPAEARALFDKAAAADPQDREALAKSVSISLRLKEYDAAQATLDRLKKLTGPAPGTMQMQAQLHLAQGKHEQARDAAMAALKVAPDFLPALVLSAQAHLALNALEIAEQQSRRVAELAPRSSAGPRLLAATYLRMNAPDRALRVLEPLLARGSTDDASIYGLAGEAALRANEPAKAAAWLGKAASLDPKDPRMVTGMALASLSQGDRERGIAELEQASAMDPEGTRADYALALTHMRNREFEKALAAIDRIEKKTPGSPMASNLRGSVFAAKGDGATARKHFDEALRRDPKFYPAASNLAQLDLRERKTDDARKRFTTLLEHDPKNVRAMIALAQIAQGSTDLQSSERAREAVRAGKPAEAAAASQEALDWLKKAREADRGSVEAALALANLHISRGQPKDAIPLLQEMLAANKEDIRLLDALGTAYLRTDQPVQAMEAFERMVRAQPGSSQLQSRLGQFKLSRGDVTGALQHLRKAVELDPKALEPRAALAAAHLRAGTPDEARKVAAALQREFPKNPAGLLLAGDLAAAERKFADAAASYRKALAMQKSPAVQVKLHQALMAGGMGPDAEALLREMVTAAPDEAGIRMYAGDVEVARKRWPEAIAHYEAVLARSPGNAIALNNSAWARFQAKDPKALEYAQKAAEAAPRSAAVLDTLGMILVDRGDTARGLETLRQAVGLAPEAHQLRLNLAEALIKTGDKPGARAELDRVQSAVKDGPAAERAKALAAQL